MTIPATLSLVIYGPPASKKNSMQIVQNKATGRWFITQHTRYKKYERDALRQLLRHGNLKFDTPVRVVCEYYVSDRRRRDLVNLLAATHDILEKSAIIKNDDLIVSVNGSRIVGVDKQAPRVEITISETECGWWRGK